MQLQLLLVDLCLGYLLRQEGVLLVVVFHLPLGFVQFLSSFKLFQVVGEAFLAKRFS